jgi:deoxyadenosine/deoxycytidine kinase
MEKTQTIITLAGFPAVGKTTTSIFIKKIKSTWDFYSTELSDVSKKDIQNLHRAKFIDYDKIQDIYITNLIQHANNIEKRYHSKILFLDRGFEDTLAVTNYFANNGLFNNYDTYKSKFISLLKKYFADITIFLYADLEVIKNRKMKRDVCLTENKRPDDDIFIKDISNFYMDWFKVNTNCILLNTSNLEPIEVAQKIILIVEKK